MKRVLSILLCALTMCAATATAEGLADQVVAARTTNAFADVPVADAALEQIVAAGLAATSARNLQPWRFAVITSKEVMEQMSGAGGGMGTAMPAGGQMPGGGQIPEGGIPEGGMLEGAAAKGQPAAAPAPQVGGGNAAPPAKAGLGSTPVAIVIYTDTESMQSSFYGGNTALFDCGLAAQNMVVAANALGYGTKLISGPTDMLNGDRHDAMCELLGMDTGMSAVAVLLIGVPASSDADVVASASTRADASDKVSYVK